jgi:hypothetical protein
MPVMKGCRQSSSARRWSSRTTGGGRHRPEADDTVSETPPAADLDIG